MSLVDPTKQFPVIIDERRGPVFGYPERTQSPSDISISTTPFPAVNPWTFLAGAVGNIIGGMVGQQRSGDQQQDSYVNQMPSMTELMMQFENNRLLKELLKSTEKNKRETSFELGKLKFPDFDRM